MLENPVRLSLDQKLQKIIRANYNFNVLDILKKSFISIKGLKLKFFLASIITLAINLIFLGIGIAMTPSHQSFAYTPSMPGITTIIFTIFYITVNNALVAGFSQITLRHLRKRHNPLLDGLFSFLPIMGRLFLINIVLLIFILIPILGVGFILQYIKNSLFEGLLVIALYCALFVIVLFYSLILFIMADYPAMGFWKVMENSRKLIMNRWLKIGIFYLLLTVILHVLLGGLYMLVTRIFISALFMYNFYISDIEMILLIIFSYY